jgi:SAM-dependent methyltransferase
VSDHYADGTYRWWHLSQPAQSWSGRWLTSGSGHLAMRLTSAADLAPKLPICTGPDGASPVLTYRPSREQSPLSAMGGTSYLRATLLRLPFRRSSFDAGLDRGCFHYIAPDDRPGYAAELRRVLRPGGELLLCASLRTAGVRNDVDEDVIRAVFGDWRLDLIQRTTIPSDTRTLEMLVIRLAT